MKSFPENTGFRLSWRSYQARVLSELEAHLGDDHLHVVAPPGSGKTILGLEVVRRLNKPTLILAPTLTIRNQWWRTLIEVKDQLDTPTVVSLRPRRPTTCRQSSGGTTRTCAGRSMPRSRCRNLCRPAICVLTRTTSTFRRRPSRNRLPSGPS